MALSSCGLSLDVIPLLVHKYHPIDTPDKPVHKACPGIDPIPLTTVVREYVTASPLKEPNMYCKFSNKAKPRPTEKPIWNPLFGESMSLYKLKTNAALHNSSPTGALIVRIRNSPMDPGSRDSIPIKIRSIGNSKELITIAGNVESIPATSIFSPSILVVIN